MSASETWLIERPDQAEHFKNLLDARIKNGEMVTIAVRSGKTRTSRQQAALEVWCGSVAQLFNEAGITREVRSPIYKDGALETDWKKHTVKDDIWRTMQVALTDKNSTTEATTVDIAKVYDALVLAFANKGIQLPVWPIKRD